MKELIILAVLVAILVGMAGFFALLLNVMQKTARREADEAIAPLRQKVLGLLERGEALKARHQKLLGTGQPDVPKAAGETEKALAAAGVKVQELYDAWTELQQRLDRCNALVDEEGNWGRKLLDEARDLALSKETASPRAEAAGKDADGFLDRLEAGPQRALAALDQARAAALKRDAGARATLEAKAAEVEAGLRNDPLGTADRAEALAKEAGA